METLLECGKRSIVLILCAGSAESPIMRLRDTYSRSSRPEVIQLRCLRCRGRMLHATKELVWLRCRGEVGEVHVVTVSPD